MVLFCSGTLADGQRCKRMISVSRIPGGNPAALKDPETMTTKFMTCSNCKKHFCDRCIKDKGGLFRKPKCQLCGGELHEPNIEALLGRR